MPVSNIHELLSFQAAKQPEAPVLYSPGRRPMAYGELLVQAEKIASQLRGFGIGCGDRIAVVLPNGPEMAVAFVACSLAGTCAPLNPNYTGAEYEFYLTDLKARLLLNLEGDGLAAASVARKLGIPVLEVSIADNQPAGAFSFLTSPPPFAFNGQDIDSRNCALVLHTSGTTSRPKLVPLTHANICASAANIQASLSLEPSDRVLNVMPLFHIHGLIGALMSSLAAGGSVICAPGFDEDRFFGWVEALQPTWYTAVPTMHQAVLKRAAGCQSIIARHPLRLIRSCSASLPPQLMLDLEKAFHTPVVEAYGMTEACHQISINPLPPQHRKPKSVGLPAGVQAAIMNENGALLPTGAIGEIVIKGENVTAGYDNNPSANGASFLDGWFRTGDQGYLDDEGYLFITGRIKEIINRGGEKIAPREVDEVFLEHPQVAQAITFAMPHATLGQDVAVAVVPKEKAVLSEEALREFAFDRLAAFKVPSKVAIVRSIPKGPTGKLQRIGLYEKLADDLSPVYAAPQSAIEKKVAALWEELLNVKQVGRLDNFFQLGGDSITAVRLVLELRTHFDIEIDPANVFRAPTVVQLSRLVSQGLAQQPVLRSLTRISRPPSNPGKMCLFCIPGTMGNVFQDLGQLASYLESEFTVFGFQDGIRNPSKIEALSEKYVGEMTGIDSEGPYLLLGVCSGAVLAFEMARQIAGRGKRVAFLGMVEPTAPRIQAVKSYLDFLDLLVRRAIDQGGRHSRSMVRLNRSERVLYLKIRLRFYAVHLAARRYRPQPCSIPIHLYVTEESFQDRRRGVLRWADYSRKPPTIQRILGTHDSITGQYGTPISEAGMRSLADQLRSDLKTLANWS